MTRYSRRPALRRPAALVLCAVFLLAPTGCSTPQEPPGLLLEPSTGAPSPTSSVPSPEPGTCFDVASAYTALTLVPLSTDGADPDFRPRDAAASVRELTPGLPAELHPAFDDAVVALESAGTSVQPAELAGLQRTLVPVGDWLRQTCTEPTPSS